VRARVFVDVVPVRLLRLRRSLLDEEDGSRTNEPIWRNSLSQFSVEASQK